MIEYIKNHPEGSEIYQNGQSFICNKTMNYMINMWCIDHLFTYQGYREAVSKKLHIKHLIPIYLCETNAFIPIKRVKDYDNIFINMHAVFSFIGNSYETVITFKSMNKLKLPISLSKFKLQVEKLEMIRNTKVKHFHSLNHRKSL